MDTKNAMDDGVGDSVCSHCSRGSLAVLIVESSVPTAAHLRQRANAQGDKTEIRADNDNVGAQNAGTKFSSGKTFSLCLSHA